MATNEQIEIAMFVLAMLIKYNNDDNLYINSKFVILDEHFPHVVSQTGCRSLLSICTEKHKKTISDDNINNNNNNKHYKI